MDGDAGCMQERLRGVCVHRCRAAGVSCEYIHLLRGGKVVYVAFLFFNSIHHDPIDAHRLSTRTVLYVHKVHATTVSRGDTDGRRDPIECHPPPSPTVQYQPGGPGETRSSQNRPK